MIAYTHYRTDPRVIRAAEAAASAGFHVDLLVLRRPEDPAEEMINGVRVIHLNQQRYRGGGMAWYVLSYIEFFLRCFFKSMLLLRHRRYAVAHIHNMPDFYVFCAVVPKLFGARIILDIHDPMPNTFSSKFKSGESGILYRLLLWQEKLSAAFADAVITVHEPVKKYVLVDQHKIPADRIEIVANFPDDSLFAVRKPLAPDGVLRIVFHGTILERYGLGNVVLAIAAMRHRDRVKATIIGEGDFSRRLKELIAEHDLGATINFDNRMYPLKEIPGILAKYNLGLVPLELSSITKYILPLKLLEYLCVGLPSVTVHNAAIDHYFGGDDCLFYNPESPESLTQILDRLVEEPALLAHYQQRALTLRDKYLWSNERRKYIAILDRLTRRAL